MWIIQIAGLVVGGLNLWHNVAQPVHVYAAAGGSVLSPALLGPVTANTLLSLLIAAVGWYSPKWRDALGLLKPWLIWLGNSLPDGGPVTADKLVAKLMRDAGREAATNAAIEQRNLVAAAKGATPEPLRYEAQSALADALKSISTKIGGAA